MIQITPEQLTTLFAQASPDIQTIIRGKDVEDTSMKLGRLYLLPISEYLVLKHIIVLVLLGHILPDDVVDTLTSELTLTKDDAYSMATDLEKGLFEKVRIKILNKKSEVVDLKFPGTRSKDDLRKEIMDTTSQDSAFDASPVKDDEGTPEVSSKKATVTPGSRSELLEQLQILDTIPNDEEIEERLARIQEQIQKLEDSKKSNTNLVYTEVPRVGLSQARGPIQIVEKGDGTVHVVEGNADGDESYSTTITQSSVQVPHGESKQSGYSNGIVKARKQVATYSTAPTEYNVDPYREIFD